MHMLCLYETDGTNENVNVWFFSAKLAIGNWTHWLRCWFCHIYRKNIPNSIYPWSSHCVRQSENKKKVRHTYVQWLKWNMDRGLIANFKRHATYEKRKEKCMRTDGSMQCKATSSQYLFHIVFLPVSHTQTNQERERKLYQTSIDFYGQSNYEWMCNGNEPCV